MEKKIKRIYVDTTVILGLYDYHLPERVEQTEQFWNDVKNGSICVIISDVLRVELKDDAIERVLQFIAELPESQVEQINATLESDNLADCYIAENVVGIGSRNDCRHVAIATIHADGIVSWNMGDMVTRADKYNSVNEAQGYRGIKIVTPNQYKEIYHGK